jgi:hypothetical protein
VGRVGMYGSVQRKHEGKEENFQRLYSRGTQRYALRRGVESAGKCDEWECMEVCKENMREKK